MSLNKVMLIGNVGSDPEIRYLEGTDAQSGLTSPSTAALAPPLFEARPAPPATDAAAETDLRKRLLRPYSRLSVCRTRELSPYFVEWRRMNSACCLLFLVIVPRHWMHLLRKGLTCLCALLRSPVAAP